METLNTLKYANRARNIKNKVTANQDKTSLTILMLRQEIQNLQLELMEYRQGKRVMGENGEDGLNDMYHENTMLSKETQNLRVRIKAMQETVDVVTAKNAQLLAEREAGNWLSTEGENGDITSMIAKYMTQIEELRTKLCESELLCEQIRKENNKVKRMSGNFNSVKMPWLNGSMDQSIVQNHDDSDFSVQELLDQAKKELHKKKEKVRRSSNQAKEATEEKNGDTSDDDASETEHDADDAEDADESDTDTESDNKALDDELNEELVELTSEISLKQKLIEELELSQKRMQSMKNQYENKLLELQNRIISTQEERDKVLKNMGNAKTSNSSQRVVKIKKDFQEKLDKMQSEVKKLQQAKKEHAKLLKSQGQYETQLKKLKFDVLEMKKAKVRLVQKMKEETTRHREQQLKKIEKLLS
jgi:kinesin family protein 4/21/27